MTTGVAIEPAALQVDGLAPGGTATRTITVRNDSDVPVVVRAQQVEEGDLLAGTAPVGVTYRWEDAARSCDGHPVVEAGERAELTLVATMPVEAGDEYQGTTGTSTLTLVATQQAGCGPKDAVTTSLVTGEGAPPAGAPLALTGAQGGGLLLAAAVLVSAGTALVRARRRHAREVGA